MTTTAPRPTETVHLPGDAGPVHLCPPEGSGLMPCCGLTPFEVPRTDRMTTDPQRVTCPSA